jgi:hypothetical protein
MVDYGLVPVLPVKILSQAVQAFFNMPYLSPGIALGFDHCKAGI